MPTAALDYLSKPEDFAASPVVVVFGDERFLKRQVIVRLRDRVLSGGDAEFSAHRVSGETAEWRDVHDELATRGLFGDGQRLVIVEEADDFVSRHRATLEDYLASPARHAVLLLEVSAWPKTTRLYKQLESSGLQLDCQPPTGKALAKWLVTWCKQQHRAKLESEAAEQLVELVGPELGLLDQELAKLAMSTASGAPITAALVQELVGGWRTKTAWEMLDAALAGEAQTALDQLDNLLAAGEHPIGILAQMSSSLRRFAAATRLVERGEATGRRITLRQALEHSGVKPFVLNKAELQLKQLGRARAGRLYRWLLETDLDLKGGSSLNPRMVLERLIVRMSKQAAMRPASSR